jgi:hypothetical protein
MDRLAVLLQECLNGTSMDWMKTSLERSVRKVAAQDLLVIEGDILDRFEDASAAFLVRHARGCL